MGVEGNRTFGEALEIRRVYRRAAIAFERAADEGIEKNENGTHGFY
jgi:hypothetical protein